MVLPVHASEVLYPDGCAEINGNLRADELRKRLNDINAALRDMLRQVGFRDETVEEEQDNQHSVSQTQKPIELIGLLLHLMSDQFAHHPDADIRLRVCAAICSLLKLFCPTNPFETLPDSKDRMNDVLSFLNESLIQLAKLHSKHDVNYPRLFTIVYTCCKLDVFTWCRFLDEGEKCLLDCLKTLLTITKNLSIWAWSDEETVQQFILNALVTLINQCKSLLTNEIVAYLLSFLIEPAKSSQPIQHALIKDLIVRCATQLEYPIQMLIQNSLVLSDQKAVQSADMNESENDVRSQDLLGEHSFIIIYALHTLQESLVAPILPCVELKLKSSNARERKRAFRLLTRIFSEPSSTIHHKNPELFATFLSRFNDIDAEVRSFSIQMVPMMLKQNPELPRAKLIDCLKACTIDRVESVRLLALKMVSTLRHESKDKAETESLFDIIYNRYRDRSLAIRKEVLAELAAVYKQNLQSSEPNTEKMVMTLNAILQMYYQPSVDDKIIVERLFKSSIVPYNFPTKERVKSLFTCYQMADDASIKAIQELLKVQFIGSAFVRDALRILVDHQGKRITGRPNIELVRIIQKLSSLLPKADKAADHLKKFFNGVHSDRGLRNSVCQLFHLRCSSKVAAQCMHDILKRVSTGTSNTGGDAVQYEHTVKLLIERCASVLFDEAFGQELLTRLVVSMETVSSQNSIAEVISEEIIRDLRILLALSVYHKDILPADDMFQYVNSVLCCHRSNSIPDVSAKSISTEDPCTPVELCLQILCCLLGGGPIYGQKDAGGSGATLDQQTVDFQATLEDTTEGEGNKRSKRPRGIRSTLAYPFYSGSGEQLYEQTSQILPLLVDFCTTGLTADYPPVPLAVELKKSNVSNAKSGKSKNIRKRGDKDEGEGANDDEDGDVVTVGQAGLAWRREKRRAKLSVRVLRQLLIVVHALAGKHSNFPKGPVSSLNSADTNAQEIATTEENGDEKQEEQEVGDGEEQAKKPSSTSTNTEGDTEAMEVDSVNNEEEEERTTVDPESACSEASRMAGLEIKIQQTLDEIVKTCLACEICNPHYITCLSTLSHIGLLFPGVYNRQLKPLMTGHLIPSLLTKDELDTAAFDGKSKASSTKAARKSGRKSNQPSASKSGDEEANASDWTLDGNVPILTRAKIAAVKLMANWLVGLKLQNKQVAQIIIRLIHRIIVHDGDLTGKGRMSLGDMSRMRLVAATSWLKIAHFQFYAEVIEVGWYQSMSYVMCDPCRNVRQRFLEVLHKGLIRLKLPLEYMAMFAHAADVPDLQFRQLAKQYLVGNVKQRREFLTKHGSFNENPKILFALLPDFVLAYTIHLLAHDPDWESPDDVTRLNVVKLALWFILEPIMAGGNNYTFLRQLLEKIKHSQDALRPDDESINTKIYMACDISLGLLLTRSSNIVWRGCEFEIKLPRSLFHRAPSSFSNPDFAQICPTTGGGGSNKSPTPLITFTPTKNAKAVKDGLIPPQLVKVKNAAPTVSGKSRQKRRQQQSEESVEESSEVIVVEEEEEEAGENVETVEELQEEINEHKEELADGTSNAYDVDLDKSDAEGKGLAKSSKRSEKRKLNEGASPELKSSSKRTRRDDEEKFDGGKASKKNVASPKQSKSNTSRPNVRVTKASSSANVRRSARKTK
ncbi:unnamed protein product [Hymenolepis diminuta]|uniref:Sister chromatid cohesion protein n=1 Tax=Hymenolepis diminuta TaxID=6216 RepID=A0A564YRK4_HYMDI|nr:unnamed protein product [Hymenolepis diminuta]